jgi:erythromycin esterase-like protein
MIQDDLIGEVAAIARPLDDGDRLLREIGDCRLVLIGEATHGSHEFYRTRARLTRRLITEKNFSAVAIEGDWPDTYRVNRFVQGISKDADPVQSLEGFPRFPTWMWRNTDVVEFVQWLREHNRRQSEPAARAGIYGLDLYSLHNSMARVIAYLDRIDPAAAARARERYACFDHFGDGPENYGALAALELEPGCENEVVSELLELQKRRAELARRDGLVAGDNFFDAEQNARLVRDSEHYYRAMFQGRVSTWNLRDRHMTETLEALLTHLRGRTAVPRVVVWAHNSHVGDARATNMSQEGEFNVGQLARERFGQDTFLIGLSTHHGTVTAADRWDGPARCQTVRPGLPGSWEEIFHGVPMSAFVLQLWDNPRITSALYLPRLQRAIGVIYKPQTERSSHYFHTSLPRQFDAVIHIDETGAVQPLERDAPGPGDELPATFPVNA